MTIKPGTIVRAVEAGSHGKPVVAVVGYAGDWATYEQAYPDQTTDSLIARMGDKISRTHAENLFPEFKTLRYRE